MVQFTTQQEFPALVDIHVHLTHSGNTQFPDHFTYLTNSASPDEWSQVLQLSCDRCFPFLGIHPECGPGPIDDIGWLNALGELKHFARSGTIGIGECGIDKRYYQDFSKQEQLKLLVNHLRIAEETNSPLCLHQVRATGSLLSIICEHHIAVPWIMHGFTGSVQSARTILQHNGYLSLGPSLMRNQDRLKELTAFIPEDRLLIETDFPYTPIPQMWKQYSYAEILFAWYLQIAEQKGVDIDRLIDIVHTNGTVFTNKQTDRG